MKTATSEPTMLRSPRRLLLAGLGILCVGLGLVGVVVPGLPTTIFLIAASYLFTRSCPWLEERLLRGRVFRPYMRYLDGDEPMPRRARVTSMLLMWGAVISSLAVLEWRDRLNAWILVAMLAAALAGTWMIASYRRAAQDRADSVGDWTP